MRVLDPFTPAERRLALLLFILAVIGSAVHGSRRLSPEVEAWLARGPAPPPPASTDTAGASPSAAAPAAPGAGRAPAAGGVAPAAASSPGGIDPNTASPARLMTLPGIGPALAGRIVADRKAHGPYRRASDLLRVPGIGPATLARIRAGLSLP